MGSAPARPRRSGRGRGRERGRGRGRAAPGRPRPGLRWAAGAAPRRRNGANGSGAGNGLGPGAAGRARGAPARPLPQETLCAFQDIDLIDILWRQDIDLGAGREIFDYSHRQKESEVDKELSDGRERGDGWRSAGSQGLDRNLLVDGETGESFPAQVTPVAVAVLVAMQCPAPRPATGVVALSVALSVTLCGALQGEGCPEDPVEGGAGWAACRAGELRRGRQGDGRGAAGVALGRGLLARAVPLGCVARQWRGAA